MLANSYLIVGPNEPTNVSNALMHQRQTIPLAWALAVGSPSSKLVSANEHHYFETSIGEALKTLDRSLAGWNYNTYFRDTLAPIGTFRKWLANYPSQSALYLNVTELIRRSIAPETDLEELRRIPEKVGFAHEEIEKKDFTLFLRELRKLSYPFVTVPITGDRKLDVQILSYEVRDTKSVEAEMALQLVGVDRDMTLLSQATKAVHLRGDDVEADDTWEGVENVPVDACIFFTRDLGSARKLFIDALGMSIVYEHDDHMLIQSDGSEFMVRRVTLE
ncbi:MAG: hypothetical protein H7X80_03605 [bacterium]|nr:hypothetical protein [Candidatus Kapabacteria bacterium]